MGKKYLIGSIEALQFHFPEHDFSHARKSLDGTQAVIEESVSEELVSDINADDILTLPHEEALEYLNDMDNVGIWYTPIVLKPVPIIEQDPRLVQDSPIETFEEGEQP